MKKKQLPLLFLCLLPIISMGQRQYYIKYNQTINSVIGSKSSGFERSLGFSAGAGYRYYFNDAYTLGGEILLTSTRLYEQKMINRELMNYTNDIRFFRLDVPLNIQIHYPRWHYGFGLGGSFLLNSSQKQTFTPLVYESDKSVLIDYDTFPVAEIFVKLSAGIRILPNLDLNMHYYQGINDIGKQYGWKKNIRVGLGLSYSLNPTPPIKSRGVFSSGASEMAAEQFKIIEIRNIIRHRVRKVSDHPNQVNINISSIGAGDSRILSIDLNSSSGELSVTGTRANIQRPSFPLYGVINYVSLDAFGNNPFECVFRFEIYEPGNWEIVLQQ